MSEVLDPWLDPDDAEPVWVMRCRLEVYHWGNGHVKLDMRAVDFGTGWPSYKLNTAKKTLSGLSYVYHPFIGTVISLDGLRPIDLKLLREGTMTDRLRDVIPWDDFMCGTNVTEAIGG